MKTLYNAYLNSTGVCTDTRKINQGCIFFALKGDNFNGNAYAIEALNKGASYVVIDEKEYYTGDQTILVSDVLSSLQELAKHHRDQLSIPVIGLTGSNGKTTTKELIAASLSTIYQVFATEGNLNNHIGVPLSLLSISDNDQIAIIEMGANHQKEIAFLTEIAQPEYGLITNIGRAHLEGFCGPEGVIKAKKELYDFIEETNGKLFINHDDEILNSIQPKVHSIRYGADSPVSGEIIDDSELLKVSLNIGGEPVTIQTNLVGGYNLSNILAAACIANEFKVPVSEIKKGLENYHPTNNRSQFVSTEKNQVIMDAYNANPSSVEAALKNFAKRDETNKLVILGDMLELGISSQEEHKNIVELISSLALNAFLVGKEFTQVDQNKFQSFEDVENLSAFLQKEPVSGHAVLVKGSRGIRLENVLKHL